MAIFVFAGLFATLLVYISQFDKKDRLLLFALFVIWYIASFQDSISLDFASYKLGFRQILNGSITGSFFRTDRDQVEIGWYLLCKGIDYIFPSFYAVTPIVYGFILYSLYRIIVLVPKEWRWLLIFYYYFGVKYFIFDMTGIRQGLSISCWILMALAIKEKRYKTAIIYTTLGISFHNSFLYSLALLPLILVPYEKISFNKNKALWIGVVLGFFTIIFVYLSSFFESVMMLSFLFEDAENESVYMSYVTEIEEHGFSWLSLISNMLMLLFVSKALTNQHSSVQYCSMFYALFIITFVLDSALGGFGSLPRMFLFTAFFALPAIPNTAFHLKGLWRHAFIVYIVFAVFYSFYTKIHTEQYINFLDYHTIFLKL